MPRQFVLLFGLILSVGAATAAPDQGRVVPGTDADTSASFLVVDGETGTGVANCRVYTYRDYQWASHTETGGWRLCGKTEPMGVVTIATDADSLKDTWFRFDGDGYGAKVIHGMRGRVVEVWTAREVTGTIMTPFGEPVRGLDLEWPFDDARLPPIRVSTTAADGAFRIGGIGRLDRLGADKSEGLYFGYLGGDRFRLDALSDRVSPARLLCRPVRAVTGTVLDQDRTPIAGASIRVVRRPAADIMPSAITDRFGRFTLRGVQYGFPLRVYLESDDLNGLTPSAQGVIPDGVDDFEIMIGSPVNQSEAVPIRIRAYNATLSRYERGADVRVEARGIGDGQSPAFVCTTSNGSASDPFGDLALPIGEYVAYVAESALNQPGISRLTSTSFSVGHSGQEVVVRCESRESCQVTLESCAQLHHAAVAIRYPDARDALDFREYTLGDLSPGRQVVWLPPSSTCALVLTGIDGGRESHILDPPRELVVPKNRSTEVTLSGVPSTPNPVWWAKDASVGAIKTTEVGGDRWRIGSTFGLPRRVFFGDSGKGSPIWGLDMNLALDSAEPVAFASIGDAMPPGLLRIRDKNRAVDPPAVTVIGREDWSVRAIDGTYTFESAAFEPGAICRIHGPGRVQHRERLRGGSPYVISLPTGVIDVSVVDDRGTPTTSNIVVLLSGELHRFEGGKGSIHNVPPGRHEGLIGVQGKDAIPFSTEVGDGVTTLSVTLP